MSHSNRQTVTIAVSLSLFFPLLSSAQAANACSSHGALTCVCNPGFAGPTCNMCAANYFGYPNCTPCACGPNGTCSSKDGSCTCNSGYAGPNCQYSSAGTCSGHGAPQNQGSCVCNAGFTGSSCNACATNYYGYPSCIQCVGAVTCTGNGSCSPAGTCACKAGFGGNNCGQCASDYWGYPNCRACPCNGHGTCSQTDGTCRCNSPWSGNNCQDKSGCTNPLGCICPPGEDPSTGCGSCMPGYYPSGIGCTQCVASTTCNGNGTCKTDGTCACKAGFSGPNCKKL